MSGCTFLYRALARLAKENGVCACKWRAKWDLSGESHQKELVDTSRVFSIHATFHHPLSLLLLRLQGKEEQAGKVLRIFLCGSPGFSCASGLLSGVRLLSRFLALQDFVLGCHEESPKSQLLPRAKLLSLQTVETASWGGFISHSPDCHKEVCTWMSEEWQLL